MNKHCISHCYSASISAAYSQPSIYRSRATSLFFLTPLHGFETMQPFEMSSVFVIDGGKLVSVTKEAFVWLVK